MKFQHYCTEGDICISSPNCRHFGRNGVHGYVVDEKYIFLGIDGLPNIYCQFTNDGNIELTDNILYEWAKNTSSFIKDTVGTVVNLRLSLDVPSILRNLNYYENGDVYNRNNPMMFDEKSFPIVSLKNANNSFFITVDNEPLYERGIMNKNVAEDLFKKLSTDIRMYIKKRWPIK